MFRKWFNTSLNCDSCDTWQFINFDLPFLLVLIRWEKPGHSPSFGYDFWYQPRHKTMISSSWGAPVAFTKGFNLEHVANGLYGKHLYVYTWPEGELKQTLDLGDSGLIPLEVSFGDITSRCYALWLRIATAAFLFVLLHAIITMCGMCQPRLLADKVPARSF